jgi:integrase
VGIAYGAGLRTFEVIALKVGDIDNARLLIRVDQSNRHKDRYMMLSQQLLDLLRRWWLIKPPREWLFPGGVRGAPLTGLFLPKIVSVVPSNTVLISPNPLVRTLSGQASSTLPDAASASF